MQFALNVNGERVNIKDAEKGKDYYCPCCGRYLASEIDGELCAGQKYDYCFKCGTKIDWSDTE